MPTTSRFDHSRAACEGPDGNMNSGPSIKAYGSVSIAAMTKENEIDAAVATEAYRQAGIVRPCSIRYYGDQCKGECMAYVTVAHATYKVKLQDGKVVR